MDCFCFPNLRVKSPIERVRCIATGIEMTDKNEIDDKNFSTLSKDSLNQHFLKSLWKIIICERYSSLKNASKCFAGF